MTDQEKKLLLQNMQGLGDRISDLRNAILYGTKEDAIHISEYRDNYDIQKQYNELCKYIAQVLEL